MSFRIILSRGGNARIPRINGGETIEFDYFQRESARRNAMFGNFE